jgi:hypothetical protein
MRERYAAPAMVSVEFGFENCQVEGQAHLHLSGKDVLGIVQSAFGELGSHNLALTEVKGEVLDQVTDGRLAKALHTAIIGAGKARCG